jgi:hypothetical protein
MWPGPTARTVERLVLRYYVEFNAFDFTFASLDELSVCDVCPP